MLCLEGLRPWLFSRRCCGHSWMQCLRYVMVFFQIWIHCNILGRGVRSMKLLSCHIKPVGRGCLTHWKKLRYAGGLEGGLNLLGLVLGPVCCSTWTGSGGGCPVPLGLWVRNIWYLKIQAPDQLTIQYPRPCMIVLDICLGIWPNSFIDLWRHWGWVPGPCMINRRWCDKF